MATAQVSTIRPEASLGIALQNDAAVTRPRPGGSTFQLFPVGIMGGAGSRGTLPVGGAIGITARVAYFPLLSYSTISALLGPVSKKPGLTLGTIALEWAPAVDGRTAPIFFSAGGTRSLRSPALRCENALMGGIGFTHRLKNRLDLRTAAEFIAPSIGRTFLQIPVALTFHL